MNKIAVYDNNSLLMRSAVRILKRIGLPFYLIKEANKDLVFVFCDNISHIETEKIDLHNKNGKVFYLYAVIDTIIAGPLVKTKDDPCVFCSLSRMRHQNKEDLLTICFNKKVPYRLGEKAEKFIEEFFKAVIKNEEILEHYHSYFEHINFNKGKIRRYKSVKNEYCSFCGKLNDDLESSFDAKFHKDKKLAPNIYRIKNRNDTDDILNKYYDVDAGTFFHSYREYLSSYIPAYGLEIKVTDRYIESGFGRAYCEKKACEISVLEAIERYCGIFDRRNKSKIYGSYKSFKGKAVNPEKMGLHLEKEMKHTHFNMERYSEDIPIYWKWAYSVKEKKKVLVPEQMVFFGDKFYRKEDTKRFVYESSNGMALGDSFEEAVLYGILELIERDNFLCAWYNQFELQEIDVNTTKMKELKELIYFLKLENIEVRFFDISMELGIPSVWAIICNKNKDAVMYSYSAAGTSFDPEKAIKSAALEVITSLPIYDQQIKVKDELRQRVEMLKGNPESVTEFDDHVLYYATKENSTALNFVLKNKTKESIKKVYKNCYERNFYNNIYLCDDLDNLLNEILKYYEDVYIVNITSKEIEKEGIYGCKVIIPGMLPMTFGQQYKRIIYKRLYNERLRRGLDLKFDININPHPFP